MSKRDRSEEDQRRRQAIHRERARNDRLRDARIEVRNRALRIANHLLAVQAEVQNVPRIEVHIWQWMATVITVERVLLAQEPDLEDIQVDNLSFERPR